MKVDLIKNDGKTYSKDSVEVITRGEFYKSSRLLRKGKFYYESTHISGPNMHIFGFSNDENSYISFSPSRYYPSAMTYFSGRIKAYDWVPFQDLKLSDIGDKHTIGLGIDTEAKQFLIRSNHEVRIIEMNLSTNFKYWRAAVGEATTTAGTKDYVSVNFGESPFHYKIPLGFTPVNGNLPIHTCRNKRRTNNMIQICIIIMCFK